MTSDNFIVALILLIAYFCWREYRELTALWDSHILEPLQPYELLFRSSTANCSAAQHRMGQKFVHQ